MKIIPTAVHGVIDYIYAVAFLVLPNLLNFADISPAATFSRIVGVIVLLQAFSTRYELGLVPLISMKTHLLMDYGLGMLLIVAPWLLGFADAGSHVWMPFVVLGVAELGATAMTQLVPTTKRHATA